MKSFPRPLILLIALGLTLSSVTATHAKQEKSNLKAEIISLRVNKGTAPFEENDKYDMQKGTLTEISILVTSSKKKILSFKENDSKLLQLDDDQGNSLLNEKKGYRNASFRPFVTCHDNHQQCVVTLRSPNLPSPKADKLHIEAKLVFQCASGKTATKEAKITPSAGGSFTFGDTKIEVSNKTRRTFNMPEEKYKKKGCVRFTSSKPFDNIASIAFFGPDGRKIKHKKSDSGSMSFMGKTEYNLGYVLLDKKIKTYTVKITYYSDAETVTLSIDQKIGVGL